MFARPDRTQTNTAPARSPEGNPREFNTIISQASIDKLNAELDEIQQKYRSSQNQLLLLRQEKDARIAELHEELLETKVRLDVVTEQTKNAVPLAELVSLISQTNEALVEARKESAASKARADEMQSKMNELLQTLRDTQEQLSAQSWARLPGLMETSALNNHANGVEKKAHIVAGDTKPTETTECQIPTHHEIQSAPSIPTLPAKSPYFETIAIESRDSGYKFENAASSVDSFELQLQEFRKAELKQDQWGSGPKITQVPPPVRSPSGSKKMRELQRRKQVEAAGLIRQGKLDEALITVEDFSEGFVSPVGARLKAEIYYRQRVFQLAATTCQTAIQMTRRLEGHEMEQQTQHSMYLMAKILDALDLKVDAKFYRKQLSGYVPKYL